MRDQETGNSKGFAFVNYASFEASDAAIGGAFPLVSTCVSPRFVFCWARILNILSVEGVHVEWKQGVANLGHACYQCVAAWYHCVTRAVLLLPVAFRLSTLRVSCTVRSR